MPLDLRQRMREKVPYPPRDEYEIRIQSLPLRDLAMTQEYYWHLFYRGQKVNGGISPDPGAARQRAEHYKWDHHFGVWRERNIWNAETRHWDMD